MWHLWKQLWWCGCVLAFYGITGHFCWGQMYSISHCIWTQIGLAWLYINCYKMTQLLGLSEASLWRIIGTVMKYEVSNNLNSNNCRVKVFLTHRCLVYFYHRKWLQNIFRRIYREKPKDSRIPTGKPSKTYKFTVEQTIMKLVEHSKVASLPTFFFFFFFAKKAFKTKKSNLKRNGFLCEMFL